jgi:DNA-directed RNA polymerase subunit N (RpoN/RPB10)
MVLNFLRENERIERTGGPCTIVLDLDIVRVCCRRRALPSQAGHYESDELAARRAARPTCGSTDGALFRRGG